MDFTFNVNLYVVFHMGYVKGGISLGGMILNNKFKKTSINYYNLVHIIKLNRVYGKYEGLLIDKKGNFNIDNIKKYVNKR
jgi:hypothetical protein